MTFPRLWGTHAAKLAHLAYVVTGDETSAWAISRRALVRAFGRFQTLKDPHEVEVYAARATVRLAARPWRRPHHSRAPVSVGDDGDRLWCALGTLHRSDRVVLALRLMYGLSPRATADVLHRTVPATDARFHRALARLRAAAGADLAVQIASLLQTRAAARARSLPMSAGTARAASAERIVTAIVGCAVVVAATWSAARVPDLVTRVLAEDRAVADRVAGAVRPPVRRFGLCPDMTSARRPGPSAAADATAVAIRFNHALIRGDASTIERLAYPAITTRDPDYWVPNSSPRGIRVTHSASARADSMTILGCGEQVARGSWEVVIHDRTPTVAEGLARYYLVRRADGWKVWGFDPNA